MNVAFVAMLCLGQTDAYSAAARDAQARKLPLVVGVGCAAPGGEWVSVNVRSLAGYQAPSIVLAEYSGGVLWWKATFPPTVDAEDVQHAVDRLKPLPRGMPNRWNPYDVPRFQGRMRSR